MNRRIVFGGALLSCGKLTTTMREKEKKAGLKDVEAWRSS
jgi:hypothetical protein